MVSEVLVVAGWATTPLLVFCIGGLAVRRQERHRGEPEEMRAAVRLEELRRERARQAAPPRGRMAEAMRLAEAGHGARSALRPRD